MAVATALVVTLVAASPAATASANTVPGTLGTAAATDVPDAAGPPAFQVVASGLNQPRRVTLGPDGTLLVSEAGLNTVPPGCKDGSQPQCVNPSGAIAEVTTAGKVRPRGQWLGTLSSAPATGGKPTLEANLGLYEGAHNPDHGVGAKFFQEQPIDSDPYAVVNWNAGLPSPMRPATTSFSTQTALSALLRSYRYYPRPSRPTPWGRASRPTQLLPERSRCLTHWP